MKDEIKEILYKLEIVARKHTIEVREDIGKIETMPASVVDELRLNNYSAKVLLDYITNLQEENERLNKDLDTSIEICNKRQEEIVRLNNIINELEKYLHIICIGDATFEEIGITQSILNRLKELKESKANLK